MTTKTVPSEPTKQDKCPQCNRRLGGWEFRIVHDIGNEKWFYRCICGYASDRAAPPAEPNAAPVFRQMVQCEKHKGLPVHMTATVSTSFAAESYCPNCEDEPNAESGVAKLAHAQERNREHESAAQQPPAQANIEVSGLPSFLRSGAAQRDLDIAPPKKAAQQVPKPVPEFVDVVWNDGLVGRNQASATLNWDNVVTWFPVIAAPDAGMPVKSIRSSDGSKLLANFYDYDYYDKVMAMYVARAHAESLQRRLDASVKEIAELKEELDGIS